MTNAPSLLADRTLVDLADRLLDRGASLTGEATISVADVDLIYLGLDLVLASVETVRGTSLAPDAPAAAIAARYERLRAQQREALRQAEHLFDTLLHKAFRGELGEGVADEVEGELVQMGLGLE